MWILGRHHIEAVEDFVCDQIKSLSTTALAIVLDLSKPWQIESDLENWRRVVFSLQKKLFAKITPQEQEQRKKAMQNFFKSYKVPKEKEEEEEGVQEKPKEEGDFSENEEDM